MMKKQRVRRRTRNELLKWRIIGAILFLFFVLHILNSNDENNKNKGIFSSLMMLRGGGNSSANDSFPSALLPKCDQVTLPSISHKTLCKVSWNLPAQDHPIPNNLCEMYRPHDISILFASQNSFTEFPNQLVQKCPSLQMISFKSNAIHSLGDFSPSVRWLILTDNQISTLPPSIGKATSLQKLMLSGNKIKNIPLEMTRCRQLQLIRLASNQLTEAPLHILRDLPNLAWIAFSGNPFVEELWQRQTLRPLPLLTDPLLLSSDENDSSVIGKGASGATRKVTFENGTIVALKTFASSQKTTTNSENNHKNASSSSSQQKGRHVMTSDGDPIQERRIYQYLKSLSLQSKDRAKLFQTSLVHVLGETPRGAVVMEFLTDYRPLGQAPSFDTCTRDVYPDTMSLSPRQAVAIVSDLLDVLKELHSVGIMHGDLYAHNILIKEQQEDEDDDGRIMSVKLSDFGASFLYDTEAEYGKHLQRIEMRAMGHLAQEVDMLVGRHQVDEKKNNSLHVRKALRKLQEAAFSLDTFSDLVQIWTDWTLSLQSPQQMR